MLTSHELHLLLPNAAPLLALHCALDDGDVNEAARIVWRLSGMDLGHPAERAWFAMLRLEHLRGIASLGGRS